MTGRISKKYTGIVVHSSVAGEKFLQVIFTEINKSVKRLIVASFLTTLKYFFQVYMEVNVIVLFCGKTVRLCISFAKLSIYIILLVWFLKLYRHPKLFHDGI